MWPRGLRNQAKVKGAAKKMWAARAAVAAASVAAEEAEKEEAHRAAAEAALEAERAKVAALAGALAAGGPSALLKIPAAELQPTAQKCGPMLLQVLARPRCAPLRFAKPVRPATGLRCRRVRIARHQGDVHPVPLRALAGGAHRPRPKGAKPPTPPPLCPPGRPLPIVLDL
jgi:hypothetical protein